MIIARHIPAATITDAEFDALRVIVRHPDGSTDWERTPCPLCLRPCPQCVCGDECVCDTPGAVCAMAHE